jgi:hypothetical protein
MLAVEGLGAWERLAALAPRGQVQPASVARLRSCIRVHANDQPLASRPTTLTVRFHRRFANSMRRMWSGMRFTCLCSCSSIPTAWGANQPLLLAVASKGQPMQRLIKSAAVALSSALLALPIGASWASRVAPVFGTCSSCCSVYPSGWRGMCVRRCNAYRRWLPTPHRGMMRCECQFTWRGEWRCGQ